MPEYVQILSLDHQKNTHFQLEGVFLYPTTAFPLLRTILKRDWKLPRHENNTYLDFYDNHYITFLYKLKMSKRGFIRRRLSKRLMNMLSLLIYIIFKKCQTYHDFQRNWNFKSKNQKEKNANRKDMILKPCLFCCNQSLSRGNEFREKACII